jgi:arabinose-5-phosphate isomerase
MPVCYNSGQFNCSSAMDSNSPIDHLSSPDAAVALARRVLRIEAEAIQAMAERVGAEFVHAVELLLQRRGRVIVCGIGKSGHIARKLASTLASTGTPAYFVHAAEAAHGDLGMITDKDVVIALSNSGTSEELLTIVPLVKRQGAQLIAMTGNPASPLAAAADVHLDAAVQEEACPLNLAPTASTTAALALGDALAVALLEARGFGPEDFARSHPGGALGRRLLTHVRDVMRPTEAVPQVELDTPLGGALLAMSQGGMGMTVVRDPAGEVAGIFTDGDLRRALERIGDLRATPVSAVMTPNPRHIGPDELAAAAADLMERQRISQLLVLGPDGALLGALHTLDLMRAKVI